MAWQDDCMGQGFGIESHPAHRNGAHRPPARYLIVIESGGTAVARLFDASRTQVAEFDAGTEEVAVMARGLAPQTGASSADWDLALAGHSPGERALADIYTLDL